MSDHPGLITSQPGLTITDFQPEPMPLVVQGADHKPIVTIHPDGRVELNRPELVDEGARIFAEAVEGYLRPRLVQ